MKTSSAKSFKLLPWIHSLFFLYELTKADYIDHLCSDSKFSNTTTYNTNLNHLLFSLTTNGPVTGFYNTTAGENPYKVFGLIQCIGDDTVNDCTNCINNASQSILQHCAYSKEGTIWYDDCLLRYSNKNFFASLELKRKLPVWNVLDVSEPDQFNFKLGKLMNNISSKAAFGTTNKMFSIGEVSVTNSETIYGLVQCTRDLSREDCDVCLRSVIGDIPSCCSGKQGGRVLGMSCIVRFEIYPFFHRAETSPSQHPMVPKGKKRKQLRIALAIAIPMFILLVIYAFSAYRLKRKTKRVIVEYDISGVDFLLFNLGTIRVATDNFSNSNKLGEGGFGPVYKGKLPDEHDVAVKRLSRSSGQGIDEFMNEVVLVAKLQHRNLVRLLGCCFEEDEKLLVYEYVQNRSLDNFLFDPTKRAQLDWNVRHNIISGVARGILYLHEESRFRIIHRDIKASNILLDEEMKPKIADFGVARLVKVDQTRAKTNKIVGTYGYMSPEYAMHGRFSVKSDVFSFGVLILEIISGQRNSSFHTSDYAQDLLSYAWKLWEVGNAVELMDQCLGNNFSSCEVLRCIHIGLLCVQEDAADRPTMPSVVLMLNSYSTTLLSPTPPPLLKDRKFVGSHGSSDQCYSLNVFDTSEIEAR